MNPYEPPTAPWRDPARGVPPDAPAAYPNQPPPPHQAYPAQPPAVPYPGQPPVYPGQPAPPGHQPYPPSQPPKPKSPTGLIVGIVAGVLVLCLGAAALVVVFGIRQVNQPVHVVVEAAGSSPAQVTFRINGDLVETASHPLPYSINRDVPRRTTLVTVIVFPIGDNGIVSCRITINGETASSQTSRPGDSAGCEAHT